MCVNFFKTYIFILKNIHAYITIYKIKYLSILTVSLFYTYSIFMRLHYKCAIDSTAHLYTPIHLLICMQLESCVYLVCTIVCLLGKKERERMD